MAITNVQWQDVYRNGSGYGTVDVNIAPSTVIAMINLTGTTGRGTHLPGLSISVGACQAGPTKALTSVSGQTGRTSFSRESAPLRSRLRRGRIKRAGRWVGWTTGGDVMEPADTLNIMSGSTGYQVRSVQACVVFDTESGEIHHVHQVVTMEGARGDFRRRSQAARVVVRPTAT